MVVEHVRPQLLTVGAKAGPPVRFTPGAGHSLLAYRRHPFRLDSRWLTPAEIVVSAHGDIDATNAGALTDYAVGHAATGRTLVLDFNGVEFFGTEGFSALHRISVGCARARSYWAIVPSAAVSRLLRICDPEGSLSTVETVDAAIAAVPDLLQPPRGNVVAAAH